MGLIAIDDACEKYDMNKKTIQSRRNAYFNVNGINPSWYYVYNKRAYIDTDSFEYIGKLERKVWIYATEKLWFIFEDLGIGTNELSQLMSLHYGEPVNTWKQFFYKYLFVIPHDIINGVEKSMTAKFVQHGTWIIYNMIKKGDINNTYLQLSKASDRA